MVPYNILDENQSGYSSWFHGQRAISRFGTLRRQETTVDLPARHCLVRDSNSTQVSTSSVLKTQKQVDMGA
jgi:hypothetical protein